MSAEQDDVPENDGATTADVFSHTQLLEGGDRAAAVLAGLGVRAGDQVAVLLPMCLESVIATLACIKLGASRITFPVEERPGFLGGRLRALRVGVVITADNCLVEGRVQPVKAGLDKALAGCPEVRSVLVVARAPRPVPWSPGRDRWWHDALAAQALAPRPYAGVMSTATPQPAPQSDDPVPPPRSARAEGDRLAGFVFDDPLRRSSSDDSDRGWGGHLTDDGDTAADLARFLDEKPPHHI